jgi:hypothetical protein
MTLETKTTIQLSDIETIEFKCADCGSVFVCPIEIAKTAPMACHCNPTKFWMIGGDETYRGISELLQLIRRFGTSQPETFEFCFGIKKQAAARASSDKD